MSLRLEGGRVVKTQPPTSSSLRVANSAPPPDPAATADAKPVVRLRGAPVHGFTAREWDSEQEGELAVAPQLPTGSGGSIIGTGGALARLALRLSDPWWRAARAEDQSVTNIPEAANDVGMQGDRRLVRDNLSLAPEFRGGRIRRGLGGNAALRWALFDYPFNWRGGRAFSWGYSRM